MNNEEEQKHKDLLDDLQASFVERRAARYVKRVKAGRAAIFIIALFNIVTVARGLEVYEQDSIRVKLASAIAIFYIVLFLMSLQRSYMSLLIATIAYCIISTYNVITDRLMFKYAFDKDIAGLSRSIFIIAIIVRLMLLYYLIYGTVYGRKFEALYDSDDSAGEEETGE